MLLDHEAARQAGLVCLPQNTWVEHWDPRAPDLIVGAAQGKAPAELYDSAHCRSPHAHLSLSRSGNLRGEDTGFYFGREPDLERLLAALDRYRLVAVVGPSGNGKSSLACAGLIPRLRRPQGGKVCQIADMRPGSNPFLALARSLLPLREPERILT